MTLKRAATSTADARVADIEQQWAAIVGAHRFPEMCATMQELLDTIDPKNSRR